MKARRPTNHDHATYNMTTTNHNNDPITTTTDDALRSAGEPKMRATDELLQMGDEV